MSHALLAYLASRAGMKIVESVSFNESQEGTMIDGLTLLEKPI